MYEATVRNHSDTWTSKERTPQAAVDFVGGIFAALGRTAPAAASYDTLPALLRRKGGKFHAEVGGIEITVRRVD